MDYKEFKESVVKELEEFYDSDATVSIHDVIQNNGQHRDGLVIVSTDSKPSISPTIYLDSVYESLIDGSKNFEDCVNAIVAMRKEFEPDENVKGMAEKIRKWKDVKKDVYPILISVSENMELLEHLVYTPFLDLAIVYIIRIECGSITNASVKITNGLFNTLGITKKELHETAMKNLECDGYQMEDMCSLLHNMMSSTGIDDGIGFPSAFETGKMYVLSNNRKFYGAAGILDSKMLERTLGGMTSFILPSSIHETIFIPVSEDVNADELNSMIREVNRTQVDVSERLSDHYYVWDGETKSVKMCA